MTENDADDEYNSDTVIRFNIIYNIKNLCI